MKVNLINKPQNLLFLFGLMCFCALPLLAEAKTPTDTVKAAITDILNVLKNENLSKEQQWHEIGRVIDAGFDFRSMSQSILATNWRTASAQLKVPVA